MRRKHEEQRRQRAASVAAAEAAQLEDEQQRRRQQRPSHATITAVAAEAQTEEGEGRHDDGEEGSWACAVCTYLHAPHQRDFLACYMCDTQRTSRPVAPHPNADGGRHNSNQRRPAPDEEASRAGGGRNGDRRSSGRGGRGGRGGRTGTDATRGARTLIGGSNAGGGDAHSSRYTSRGGGASRGEGSGAAFPADWGGFISSRGAREASGDGDGDEEYDAARSDGVVALMGGQVESDDVARWTPRGPDRSTNVVHLRGMSGVPAPPAPRPSPTLEPWEETEPSVSFWLRSCAESGAPPDAELLLRYAAALSERGKLDELGCLCRLVERSCVNPGTSEGFADALRDFADGVDRLVAASYGGELRFEPLRGIRSTLERCHA